MSTNNGAPHTRQKVKKKRPEEAIFFADTEEMEYAEKKRTHRCERVFARPYS